ncbi:MAG: CDP-diacylglycerol--serine O-phosphatidyltransferase [Gammaproteobacteria bacterium]|nr:CDP-diacylglycerol--serine O-phosphatidyltransferase [Gammaproteobacteria bacterium]
MSRARLPRETDTVTVEEGRTRPKGIYILPSLFTTANLFAGFYAIAQSMNGNFELAPLAIFVAMLLDTIDGRVARLTHTESEFGFHYDSLVDMVSFGLAPALIMYQWALAGMGKLGWLAAFIYAAGAGLRLARFNALASKPASDKRYFRGLPSPSAAALVVGFVWVLYTTGVPGRDISILALVVTVVSGLLMVSNIRYRTFKDLDMRGRMPFVAVIIVPLVFVLVFLDPPQVLFAIFLGYAISGPASWAVRLLRPAPTAPVDKSPHP